MMNPNSGSRKKKGGQEKEAQGKGGRGEKRKRDKERVKGKERKKRERRLAQLEWSEKESPKRRAPLLDLIGLKKSQWINANKVYFIRKEERESKKSEKKTGKLLRESKPRSLYTRERERRRRRERGRKRGERDSVSPR